MACDAMLGCLRLSVFNFSFLCSAVPELLEQTGYTRTGEPFPDLHACVQPEGDCHHPTAQGQDPSAPEELSVSPPSSTQEPGPAQTQLSVLVMVLLREGQGRLGISLNHCFLPQNSSSLSCRE